MHFVMLSASKLQILNFLREIAMDPKFEEKKEISKGERKTCIPFPLDAPCIR